MRYSYGPYGEPDTWTGSRFRYTGQIALPEIQLYHYKARVYDPVLGRFLQTDPIGYEVGMNIYEYAWLDPINASDPSGLYTCDGTEEECERISNYVDQARREARREAFRSIMPRTMNYARALSRFYGAEGEDNNVVVRNADLPEGIPGETVPPSRSGRIEIRFDLEAIQSHEAEGTGFGNLTGMAVAIHEGWHGVQFRGPWTTATYTPLYEMERSAYRAEFYGLRAAGWEPFVAMTPREREEWIRRQAHRSTQAARARRGY